MPDFGPIKRESHNYDQNFWIGVINSIQKVCLVKFIFTKLQEAQGIIMWPKY